MQDISEEILTKAAKGDIRSFEIIYKAAASFVYNVAFRVVSNRQDAEEVTQEVFLNIYHKLQDFRFESSFKTWIYRITANHAINHSKKRSKERDRRKEYDASLTRHKPLNATQAAISTADQQEAIHALLQSLNPHQRACIVLRSIEGLSYQQIAAALNININTVRSRLKRAREALLALRKEVINNEL